MRKRLILAGVLFIVVFAAAQLVQPDRESGELLRMGLVRQAESRTADVSR